MNCHRAFLVLRLWHFRLPLLFLYPFSKRLSSTYSVYDIVVHIGGNGRAAKLKPQGKVLALEELPRPDAGVEIVQQERLGVDYHARYGL